MSSSNMSKEIAHVFRVEDLVFCGRANRHRRFFRPKRMLFGLSGFNELLSLFLFVPDFNLSGIRPSIDADKLAILPRLVIEDH